MKNTYLYFGILGLSLSLAACKATKVMDATLGMADTTQGMATTTREMAETTQGMRSDMGRTNHAVHLQTLSVALENIAKEENIRYADIPVRMAPFAKVIADDATPAELAELAYIWIKEINEVYDNSDGSEEERQRNQARLTREKIGKLIALELVASLTADAFSAPKADGSQPENKIQRLIEQQIETDGEYKEATLAFMAMRTTYLQSFFLNTALLEGNKTQYVGQVEKAVRYARQIEFLVNQSFAAEMKVELPNISVSIAVDPLMMEDVWLGISREAQRIASRYTEQAVEQALERAQREALDNNRRPLTPAQLEQERLNMQRNIARYNRIMTEIAPQAQAAQASRASRAQAAGAPAARN